MEKEPFNQGSDLENFGKASYQSIVAFDASGVVTVQNPYSHASKQYSTTQLVGKEMVVSTNDKDVEAIDIYDAAKRLLDEIKFHRLDGKPATSVIRQVIIVADTLSPENLSLETIVRSLTDLSDEDSLVLHQTLQLAYASQAGIAFVHADKTADLGLPVFKQPIQLVSPDSDTDTGVVNMVPSTDLIDQGQSEAQPITEATVSSDAEAPNAGTASSTEAASSGDVSAI